MYNDFTDLILLIGTNPLPNFVIADFFLKNNLKIQKIWLIHSEKLGMQAGTFVQAKNIEDLLEKRWKKVHPKLQFPIEKVTISDVSSAKVILHEVETKMIKKWKSINGFHFNYTGGTKSMAINAYLLLLNQNSYGKQFFSYLDARNYYIVEDNYGIITDDLREKINISFEDIITLHGFKRCNEDKEDNKINAINVFGKTIENKNSLKNISGDLLEMFVAQSLKERFINKNIKVLQNWKIQKLDWGKNDFELDVIMLFGYQLIGISCTISDEKDKCKKKGFEIIQRSKQIGGDEAKAILITGSKSNQTQILKKELILDTGGSKDNILVLGFEELKSGLFSQDIEKFILR